MSLLIYIKSQINPSYANRGARPSRAGRHRGREAVAAARSGRSALTAAGIEGARAKPAGARAGPVSPGPAGEAAGFPFAPGRAEVYNRPIRRASAPNTNEQQRGEGAP